jgi:uncharacterized membrane protein
MEGSVEERLRSIEARLEAVEQLLSRGPQPAPSKPKNVWGFETEVPPRAPKPAPPPRAQPRSIEDLLGGRVLAWLGGVAVVLGFVFFLVMAVSRGWIDEPTRVVLAFAGSTALLAAALWLYERRGQTQAALAAAAAALASLYASITVGTAVYDVIPEAAGFVVAGLVGAAGAAIAVRWNSKVVGGVGILGALLAPVLVQAGASSASLAFMVIALLAAVAVLVWQRWPWLAFGSFLVSVPQLLDWIDQERGFGDGEHRHLVPILVVLLLFWAIYLAAALAYELRAPGVTLGTSSALLLFADVLLVASTGWWVLHDAGRTAEATIWVLVLAAAHVGIGAATIRSGVGPLLVALGTALSAIGFALALDGPALVVGWAVHAMLLAWLGARLRDERAAVGAAIFLALALGHVLVFEAPPNALADGLDHPASALVGLAVVVVATVFMARFGRSSAVKPEVLGGLAAATAVYLVSVGIVDAAGASQANGTTQSGQLLLSAFWSVTGLAAIVVGLVRDLRLVRLGGLVLLGIAVVKVFFVDLATLESIYRVASFIALGLLLIACAFAYQSLRREGQG